MKPFFAYMLRCADGSYYVGHTDDLERRIAEHRAGAIAGCYTHDRRPVELVWSGEATTREEALAFERRLKGWSRAKKEALIAGDWERVSKLATSGAGLRQAQPERGAEDGPGHHSLDPAAVRTEPVEGPDPAAHGLRQAQPERGGEVRQGRHDLDPAAVRPEPVEGPGPAARGLRQAQPERGGEVRPGHRNLDPAAVRPEPVEGLGPNARGLRQAQPERAARPAAPPAAVPDAAIAAIVTPGPAQRRALAKAITLLESTRADHRARADALLTALLPHAGRSLRLGISGVPGVGKSTFIEALGLHLLERGHRVAVLAVDPSSSLSGGSILGDKTRMERLSADERAYIRPSPAAGTLGGVAAKTREAMLLCEAAGHDVVIVETVGVGQSEVAVAGMTDLFVLLQLPNAGDDLQAIKKGVMELADLVVVNKADLDPAAATRAEAQIVSALRLVGQQGRPEHAAHDTTRWQPRVLRLSALTGEGVAAFWAQVEAFRDLQQRHGGIEARRRRQAEAWMWDMIHAGLREHFLRDAGVRAELPETKARVLRGELAASTAARALLARFERH